MTGIVTSVTGLGYQINLSTLFPIDQYFVSFFGLTDVVLLPCYDDII